MTRSEVIRRVTFRPYRKGIGPTFTLTLRDSKAFWDGVVRREYPPYQLTMRENGRTLVLFRGDDWSPSPLRGIDSDDAVKSIMGFLTLRPGDTDSDYFADYTEEQMAFCDHHAEALSVAVFERFGEET